MMAGKSTTRIGWFRSAAVVALLVVVMPCVSAGQVRAAPVQVVSSGPAFELQYTVTFSRDDLSFGKSGDYDTVALAGGSLAHDAGKPLMPVHTVQVALPAGMKVTGVRLTGAESVELPGEYLLAPAQPPRWLSERGQEHEFVPPDAGVYESAGPFPAAGVEFGHQADLAGQSFATVHLFPVRYAPRDRRLSLYTSMTVGIDGVGGYVCGDYLPLSASEKERAKYERTLAGMVVNPESVELRAAPVRLGGGSRALPAGGPYDHVIITSSSYQSYWEPVVEWHTKRGLRDTVVTTTYIYSNYSGSDNQAKIRNFVADAHATWNTRYFLMAGEDGTVPFKYRNYLVEAPSDHYYSDYDDDWVHEVFVGRVTAEGSSQINLFVDKLLKYEKDPPLSNYVLDVLLIGMDADSSTHIEYMKDDVDLYIPARFDVTKVYDSDGGNHKTATVAALNDGQHLVNHGDHGGWNYMGTGDRNHGLGLYNSDIDALSNNDRLSIVVSLACHPNEMDYSSDCIAEHFVIYNASQAGIAFTGNTRDGLYYGGNNSAPYYLSNKLDYWWWRALFAEDKYVLGETLAETKHNFGTDPWNPDAGRYCMWEFNLLGEPAMPIWTDTPESLSVSHPSTWTTGSYTDGFEVEVSSGGVPLYEATVCLWKGDEVYAVEETGPAGTATFDFAPATAGIMYVTATARDKLPYEGQVDVYTAGEGDFDWDGDVDLADFAAFQSCLGEIGVGNCWAGNLTGTWLVELDDFAAFAARMVGP